MSLFRTFAESLASWASAHKRLPLVVRGARQVGKSYSVRAFAKANFEFLAELNFERNPELEQLFNEFDAAKICRRLSQVLNVPVEPKRTLLFLDEIQECPAALSALRYFHEELPQLHVIAAGSLLDFILKDSSDSLRVPVGRIEYRFLGPLSFAEFLVATDNQGILSAIREATLKSPLPEVLHKKALSLVGDYLQSGGMPAVVLANVESSTTNRYQEIQSAILQTYRDDFRKYRHRIDLELIDGVFRRLPLCATKPFKFSELYPETQSRSLRRVLDLFGMAKIITKVHRSAANGLPLDAEVDPNDYKFLMCDVGLLGTSLQTPRFNSSNWNLEMVNAGALAEQFVGQELLATHPVYDEPRLYYWRREARQSQAEVDYVVAHAGRAYPVEVKAGATGRLKSLRQFIETKSAPLGIRISQLPLSYYDQVLSCPLYAISELGRLVEEALA